MQITYRKVRKPTFVVSQHRTKGHLVTVQKKTFFLPLGAFGCGVTHVTAYYWPRVPVGAKIDIHQIISHKVVIVIYHFNK